ncbi:HEAT repeat-containing protein 1 [Aplysia californica]|uniref:HEAT repeat-containing protein 1 n=1 Tax=Aplysia californica TaxID=6500 RepID=A0ABM1VZV2_APLCA|nr:HEAT repeat-containing protein 1 [Aplysia californica]
MTSLAAQLKKLAIPETQGVLSSGLQQASFLYAQGEAATYDKQHFYNIGINGLQQLIEKDACFEEFEQNLFAPSSQSLQRYIQTSEVNKQLDQNISRFLLQLSPYMQLRESHKAMEWLVHRYNIHLRNVDALMMCVLPYHDQDPFMRALRLLNMSSKECAMWRWLEPIKKGESFLPRQTLVTHCRSAKGFLGFICDMLAKHIEANTDDSGVPSRRRLQRVISFYTQTVLGVLMAGPPTEHILSTLIPSIGAGLRSRDMPDHMTSAYMVLSQLLVQTTLESSLLESLLNVLCKNIQPSLVHAAVTVVVLIFQRQAINKVSKKAFRYLTRQSALLPTLSQLSREANAEPFLTPFMSMLTQRALKESDDGGGVTSDSNTEDDDATPPSLLSLLLDAMNSVKLKEKTIIVVVRSVLDWFSKQRKESEMEVDGELSPSEGAFRVFRLLENRFSSTLESVVKEMTTSGESKGIGQTVKKLYKMSVQSAQDSLESDAASALTVCLHHHNEAVRKSAVERLLQDVQLMEDRTAIQSILVSRIQDDSSEVVMAVLDKPETLWELFEDKKLLEKTLCQKLLSLKGKAKGPTTRLVLRALSCIPFEVADDRKLLALFLSHLVPLALEDVTLASELLESSFVLCSKLLEHLNNKFLPVLKKLPSGGKLSAENRQNVTEKLVECVASYLANNSSQAAQFVQDIYNQVSSSPRPGSAALVLIMSCFTLAQRVKKAEMKMELQRVIVSLVVDVTLSQNVVSFGKSRSGPVMSSCLDQLSQDGRLSVEVVSYTLQELNLCPAPAGLKEAKFWDLWAEGSPERNWLVTLTSLTTFLLELSASKSPRVAEVARSIFPSVFKVLGDNASVMKFLCWMWTSDAKRGVTGADKARCLQFSQVFVSGLALDDRVKLTSDPAPTLPCLLLLLSSPFERVRGVAFTLLSTLTKDLSSETSNYKWTANSLMRYKEEVVKDENFLPQVLKNILESEDAVVSPPSPKKRRKSSSKLPPSSVALSFLMDVILDAATPGTVKVGLLRVLHRLDTAESFLQLPSVLASLIPTTDAATPAAVSESTLPSLSSEEKETIMLVLGRYTRAVASCVEEGSGSLSALQGALACPLKVRGQSDTVQIVALEQLSSKFMSGLQYECRRALVIQLLDMMSFTASTEVQRRSRKVIKKMTLEASLVVDELKMVTTKTSAGTVRESKKQRSQKKDEPGEMGLESLPWRRVTSLLELVQSKKKVTQAELMVPALFQLLARVLELEEEGSGEYVKQLVLGTVYNICSRQQVQGSQGVKGEHLNMELVVQCIQTSDNPHTHQQALLLLSAAAKIAPTLLLHNMMSVFTFMGANILRQDDAYSFHVIGRILENVIPALLTACEQKSKEKSSSSKSKKSSSGGVMGALGPEEVMTAVLRVFVEAMPHVPAHRRMLLCEKLVSVVGAARYLWRMVLLVLERITVRPSRTAVEEEGGEEGRGRAEEEEKTSGPVSVSDMEFLTSLCEEFSCSQLLQCFTQTLAYIAQLPEEKVGTTATTPSREGVSLEEMGPEDLEMFSVSQHSAKQLRHFKFAALYALRELVAGQHFVAQMSSLDPNSFLPDFQQLMETTLQFIGQVTVSHDKHREDSSARFWRILLHKSHDLLDGLVHLLPDTLFLDVVSGLMQHRLTLVQRRALELLNNKLVYFKENTAQIPVDLLTSMRGKLQATVKQSLLTGAVPGRKEEELVIGQAAMYGLKVLCRILGEKQQEDFVQVLDLCTSVLSRHHGNGVVAATAMLCIAEVVSCCKVHALTYLGQFVPLIVSQLQSEEITHHETLLLATMSSLQKVMESLPLFLSPYLRDITVQLCLISAQLDVSSGTHKPVVLQKVKSICTTVATVTPTRTFLPMLEKSFVALEKDMAACAACAMSMLREHVVKMSREELTTFSQDLLQFFLVCFDLRVTHTQIDESDLDSIEGCIIDAFVSLVFKLSEAQFKPMLIQLFGWATDEEASRDRVLVFYRLCHSLAEKLKNLFTLFAGHILKHSAETLDLNNKTKQKVKYFGKGKAARRKSCRLLVYVTDTLQQTFAHDTEGFVTKERFDVVMQPLVDQLENDFGKDSVCEERTSNHVVPCLGSLAAASQDDSLWKDMNYQILLKTRHEDPKVRIWAISAVDAFHKQLGEDYTQLVPETIPFLAELMEDESDEVEKHTQKVLAAMETSVGENLQEYF